MRLLVTRPEPEAGRFCDALHHLGFETLLHPVLTYRALQFDPMRLHDATALIVTSGNGIRALADAVLSIPHLDLPIFCVGAETVRKAQAAGFETIAGVGDTASDLVAVITSSPFCDGMFVHISGQDKAFDLEAALHRQSVGIHTLNVYKMEAVDSFAAPVVDAIASGTLQGVTLLSPRTTEVYLSLSIKQGLTDQIAALDHFCLSDAVAAPLHACGYARIKVAERPTRDSFLSLLLQDLSG